MVSVKISALAFAFCTLFIRTSASIFYPALRRKMPLLLCVLYAVIMPLLFLFRFRFSNFQLLCYIWYQTDGERLKNGLLFSAGAFESDLSSIPHLPMEQDSISDTFSSVSGDWWISTQFCWNCQEVDCCIKATFVNFKVFFTLLTFVRYDIYYVFGDLYMPGHGQDKLGGHVSNVKGVM